METIDKYGVDWSLVASYLSGNASESEKSEFQAWIDKSDKNKEVFHSIEKLWKVTENADLTQINVENAWRNVNSKSHIVTLSHTKYLFQKTYKYSLRIAAVLIIGLFSWYIISNLDDNKTARSGSSVIVLSLNDGSQVTLNRGTKLNYPKIFKDNYREVYLDGEAFFNVVKNPQKPFIIKTRNAQIKVLGTSFNVNTNRKGNIEVVVNSGTVTLKGDISKKQVILHKDDKGIILNATGVVEKSINSDPNYIAWKTRKFVFHDTSLKNIFENIEDVYDVHIVAKDSAIYNCKMTATFEKLSIEEIINSIDLAFKYKSTKNDNFYTIIGSDCTKNQ